MKTLLESVDLRQSLAGTFGLPKLEQALAAYEQRYDPDAAMLWTLRKGVPTGHTPAVRKLARSHDGRDTARWLLFHWIVEGGHPDTGKILAALEVLQDKDPASSTFGCSRWYHEDDCIADTNAAFFIAQALLVFWMQFRDAVEPDCRDLLERYFRRAAHWFERECRDASLFYPNKIISDGSLALALGGILNDSSLVGAAEDFLGRWCDYTETRGWGWGEIMSLTYSGVILNALWLIRVWLESESLAVRITRLADEVVENAAFHAGQIMMPAIRTYHFSGSPKVANSIYSVLGLSAADESLGEEWLSAALLGLLRAKLPAPSSEPSSRPQDGPEKLVRTQRIFDRHYATTYKSPSGRLGTISRFPVMPGCYQHETWGLGWQSMPAGFSVADNFGFLQWETRLRDGQVRTHPAESFQAGYAATALFAEKVYPETTTTCRQFNHAALIVRTMTGLSHECSALIDQWRLPDFHGECWTTERVSPGQPSATDGWIFLLWPGAAIAILALDGLPIASNAPAKPVIEIGWDETTLVLRNALYSGQLERIEQDRAESAWAVLLLEECSDASDAARRIADYHIEETWLSDGTLPRSNTMRARRTRLHGKDCDLFLECDPYHLFS